MNSLLAIASQATRLHAQIRQARGEIALIDATVADVRRDPVQHPMKIGAVLVTGVDRVKLLLEARAALKRDLAGLREREGELRRRFA